MRSLDEIITEIRQLEQELVEELQRKQEKYSYIIEGKRVRFTREVREYHRTLARSLRDYFLQRLPAVGSGRIRPIPIAVAMAITVFLIATLSTRWQAAFGTTLSMGVVLLSIVVITGYAGQLSLGQFALAGIGALVAGQLMDHEVL